MISAPRNHFPLHEGGHVVLLAAGIGITPLLAMAHARAASGASFTLHYYVSRAQEAAFATEIDRQLTGGICQIHCSDEGRVRASGWRRIWGSGRRHPGLLLRSARIYGPGSRYRTGGRMGGGAIAQRSVPAARPDGGVGGGRNLHHHPHLHRGALAGAGDKTIAQVLQEHGVAVPLSCEMGICGACLTPVREGTVDHRDTVQSEAEKQAAEQHIALCCSRSLSANLVIDLAG